MYTYINIYIYICVLYTYTYNLLFGAVVYSPLLFILLSIPSTTRARSLLGRRHNPSSYGKATQG